MPDLRVRDLTMEFSSGGYKVRPIDSFDLDVVTGDLVLLLGASGCGKTTLLSMFARLLTPTSGTITFGDIDVTGLSGADLVEYRRQTVGIVFQAFNLIPSLTARENVQIALQSGKVPARAAKARSEELLQQVGLQDRMTHRPADMSGGQQQRVAIARALAHDPPLVLADEPTAHLDYIQVDGVLRLLRELAQPGRVVVVATHDERLLPLADRVVELTPRAAGDARPPEPVELSAGEVLFRQGDQGDGDGEQEDPAPADLREQAADDEAQREAGRAGGGVHGDRLVAGGALGEARGDDGQAGRGREGRGHALDEACGDQQ